MSSSKRQSSKLSKSSTKSHRRYLRIQGRLVSHTFSRKVDADRWYQEMKREKELIESGLKVEKKCVSLSTFSEQWLEERLANGKPLSSYNQDATRLRNYILPSFGHRSLETITTQEWEIFCNKMVSREKLSFATRNRIRALLSKLYNDALRHGLVSVNPITPIPKIKESMVKWSYWASHEDCAKYLEAAEMESPSFHMFASVALNTGARVGEILALDRRDIDLERRRFRICKVLEPATRKVYERTKGFSERWLGINESLFDVLNQYLDGSDLDKPLVAGAGGGRWCQRRVRTLHLRICKEAGLKPIRVHDLRHTFASHYVMNGGSLAELQGLLGHTSPNMTLKYSHMAPGFLESRAGVVSFSTSPQRSKMKLVSVK